MNNQRRSKPQSLMATIAADLDAALAPIITQPLRYCCCHPLDYDISDDISEELSYHYKSRRGDYRYATTQARHNMNGAAQYPHEHKPSKKEEVVNISRHQSASSCSTLKTRNTFKQQHQHDQYQGDNPHNNNNNIDDMEEPPDITRYPILGSSMIPIPKRSSSVSTSVDTSSTHSSSSSSQDMSLLFDEEVDL